MIHLGEVAITPVVEIGRSSFPTASMLPDSTPGAVAAHCAWLKPYFFERHADSGVLVLAAHFPRPGYIGRADGGTRFMPAA